MALCAIPDPDAGLVVGLVSTVDCNVQGLTESAYGLLAAPGSPVTALLTAFLTLYVAFIGYRLILGRGSLSVGDFAVSAIKIGLVLALAVNWPIYQAVVYETLFRAPEQFAGLIAGAGKASQSALAVKPFEGLQLAYDELGKSATAFAGRAGGGAASLQGGPGFAAFGLNSAGFLMLASTVGLMLVAKVALALLLGLGPIVAGFLLFDATRGLVEGWLKAMIAFALVPLLATVVLTAELAAIEPFLAQLIAMRTAARFELAPASAVFLLSLVFAGVIAAGLIALGVVAAGLKLPRASRSLARSDARAAAGAAGRAVAAEPSRAFQVAASAAALERRDQRSLSASVERRISQGATARGPATSYAGPAAPLGQTYRRASQPRRSAASARRDR